MRRSTGAPFTPLKKQTGMPGQQPHSEEASRYFLLISVHGLIRGRDLELGRDADTGGQTKYVVDLARSLAAFDPAAQVDLVTRRIVDDAVSADYAQRIEPLGDNCRILRIDCGPEAYIAKEQLWDYLDMFVDNLHAFLKQQNLTPDLVHGHYADAGYVGVRLANHLGVPLVFTGHSLGRDKRRRLLANGMSREDIEKTYNVARRIDAEELTLANADLVITSTQNEIEDQYGLYSYYDPADMDVIPPGTDLDKFRPPAADEDFGFIEKLQPFFREPDKPVILALSRPDERKNILTLIDAYGGSPALQRAANLLIVAGNREDIRDLDAGARSVLTNILLLIDSHDLYGKVAVPKQHAPDDVPNIYRVAAASGGVFINPALTEPFGLTLLEAAASGLPIVATENGGPVDIIANCKNGILVDPLDRDAIAAALLDLLCDRKAWQKAARNGIAGVRRNYSWQAHARRYCHRISKLRDSYAPVLEKARAVKSVDERGLALFTDLDHSLVGDKRALKRFKALIEARRRELTFGVATGRRIDSALSLIRSADIPRPEVLITSLGTRIHYGPNLAEDSYWADHIDRNWSADRVRRALADLPGLEPQDKQEQSRFKVSYFHDPATAPSYEEIVTHLRESEITANVLHSFGQFLDVIPSRASKGQALRYCAERLEIPLERILVAGGSGADDDLMRGNTLAVVVGNRHKEELSELAQVPRIYFARKPYAAGILEAIEHYDLFGRATA
jgi:sucrose-phosphate synthase